MHKCSECGKEFESGQQLGAHITNTHKKDIGKKISEINTLARISIKKKCEKCGKEFEIIRTIKKNGTQHISKREKRFCSRFCANSKDFTKEQNKSKGRRGEKNKSWKPELHTICQECGKEIKRNKTGLCKSCWNKLRSNPHDRKSYKYQCRFKFNVYDYPDKFDLYLAEEYGWYHPVNTTTPNLNGVSLDHMYSVSEAHKNNVGPEIISHPANCKIMLHSENNSKDKKSSISLEELKNRIELW